MLTRIFDAARHAAEISTDSALEPVRDAADVFNGLTECELRVKAATRLGADVVAGMSTTAIVDYLIEEELI